MAWVLGANAVEKTDRSSAQCDINSAVSLRSLASTPETMRQSSLVSVPCDICCEYYACMHRASSKAKSRKPVASPSVAFACLQKRLPERGPPDFPQARFWPINFRLADQNEPDFPRTKSSGLNQLLSIILTDSHGSVRLTARLEHFLRKACRCDLLSSVSFWVSF